MRHRAIVAVAFLATAALTLSLLRGQATPGTPAPLTTPPKEQPPLTQLHSQMKLAGQRGADWLFRMHTPKGRFHAGFLPALKQVAEGDFFLRQAAAAAALGRAARFLGKDNYAARATEAVLSLLEDTDAREGRRTAILPGTDAYKQQCAAALLVAIAELPSPQADVLDKGEQLCAGLRAVEKPTALALLAIIKSHKHRPVAWKPAFVSAHLAACKSTFEKSRSPDDAAALACACANLHFVAKDKAAALCLYAVADLVCEWQHSQFDPRRMAWFGGFKVPGADSMPTADGAGYAIALVEACRVAADQGDIPRHQRCTEATERGLQFLASLQYTDAGTAHFAPWYKPHIVGGFHASPVEGDLRLDHTAYATAALLAHVEYAPR